MTKSGRATSRFPGPFLSFKNPIIIWLGCYLLAVPRFDLLFVWGVLLNQEGTEAWI